MSRGLASSEYDLMERLSTFLNNDQLVTIDTSIARLQTVNSGLQRRIDASFNLKEMLVGFSNQLEKLCSADPQPTVTKKAEKKRSVNSVLKESRDAIEAEFKRISNLSDASDDQTTINLKATLSSSACDMNMHIKQFLTPCQQTTLKLQNLRTRLDQLVCRTKAVLKREEPYIEEKIMKSILKEMKTAGNLGILQSIKRQSAAILRKQQSRTSSTNSKQSVSHMVALLAQNVNLLKEVKDRKILNNDQIFECCKKLENGEVSSTTTTGLSELNKVISELRSACSSFKVSKVPRPSTAEENALQMIRSIDCKTAELSQRLNGLNNPQIYGMAFTSAKLTELQQEQTRLFKRLQAIRIQLPAGQS